MPNRVRKTEFNSRLFNPGEYSDFLPAEYTDNAERGLEKEILHGLWAFSLFPSNILQFSMEVTLVSIKVEHSMA
jgi:hypothetical protein